MMQTAYFAMGEGGLDLTTPAIVKKAQRVIAGKNYEPRPEGYRRCSGFERFDGRPQPHKASYYILNFDAGQAAISEGDTVTGATSGATGVALIDAVVESGTYGGNDAAGYLVLDHVTGTFQDNENLQVSAATKSVADGTPTENSASTDALNATYLQDAIETRRSAIGAVSGSGNMRGVWRYNGVCYAFRDNAAGTACNMWKSTASGWVQVDLGYTIDFSAGTAAFQEDETLTGGTSGATGTIKRVIVQSGDWSTNDAAGYIVLHSPSGTFQAAETITGGTSSGSATADGAQAAITLSPGGRYEFRNYNFYGATALYRMYGVDGVNNGFEFDGTTYVPIRTGMDANGGPTDAPIHLGTHVNHLFFAYAGGSLQHSGIGDPYEWSITSGATELGMGDEITGIADEYRTVMVIYTINKTKVLYGTSSVDWDLRPLSNEAGAYRWSVQELATLVVTDQRGIRDLSATESYGDFAAGTLSKAIDRLLRQKRDVGATVTASTRVRDRDQYRVFFSDGTGVCMDVSGGTKARGFMPWNYGKTVYCACSVDDSDGTEWLLFGSDDGYVYRADVGNSFDDEDLEAFIRTPFNHLGDPNRDKRYSHASIEITAGPDATVAFTADFNYGTFQASVIDNFDINGGGGFWDEVNWDEFYWDAPTEGRGETDIDGIGANISLCLATSGKYEEPHTIHGLTLHYQWRRQRRIL